MLAFSFGTALVSLTSARAQVKAPASSPTPDPAASGAFAQLGNEVAQIFAKCRSAVVRIESTDICGTHDGTGFFIDPSGTIYTHYSVAGRSWDLLVEFAGKKYPATCLLADPVSGATLLKIQAGQTPFLPLAKSSDLKIASPVIAIGYPMDLPVSPTFGLVAGFDQTFLGHFLPTTHIRANVPVQPGESGAPLLNEQGEVVGIVASRFDYGAVCMGLPIQAAEKVRSDFMRFGRLRPGWIGVTAKPIGGEDDESGVCVEDLADESPAARCGLETGDVLKRIGKKAIHRFADLYDATFFITADETVPIVVERGDKELTFQTHATDLPGKSMALPPLLSNQGIATKLEIP